MKANLHQRITETWVQHFGLTLDAISGPGTTLIEQAERTAQSFVTPWPVGAHVVINAAPAQMDDLRGLVAEKPADHCVTVGDLLTLWPDAKSGSMKMYALDREAFVPVVPGEPFTVRALSNADEAAFDAFIARCPEDDAEEADVGIMQEAVFGVLDGERIVAAASIYEWYGFVDIGVLTDPAYRQRGLGTAVVAAMCAALLDDPRVVVYRHDVKNNGSQRVAESIGALVYFAEVGSVRRTAV